MKITIEVPDKHIDGALAEPHSRYWASEASWTPVRDGAFQGGFVVEREGKGGEPECHALDSQKLERALQSMALDYCKSFVALVCGNYDGDNGDTLLQLMAFGEVRYG